MRWWVKGALIGGGCAVLGVGGAAVADFGFHAIEIGLNLWELVGVAVSTVVGGTTVGAVTGAVGERCCCPSAERRKNYEVIPGGGRDYSINEGNKEQDIKTTNGRQITSKKSEKNDTFYLSTSVPVEKTKMSKDEIESYCSTITNFSQQGNKDAALETYQNLKKNYINRGLNAETNEKAVEPMIKEAGNKLPAITAKNVSDVCATIRGYLNSAKDPKTESELAQKLLNQADKAYQGLAFDQKIRQYSQDDKYNDKTIDEMVSEVRKEIRELHSTINVVGFESSKNLPVLKRTDSAPSPIKPTRPSSQMVVNQQEILGSYDSNARNQQTGTPSSYYGATPRTPQNT